MRVPRFIPHVIMTTLAAVLVSGIVPPDSTAASPLDVDALGRVTFHGAVLTTVVRQQVFNTTRDPEAAALAARLVQEALDEAVLEWRTQRLSKRWYRSIEAAMKRKQQVVVERITDLENHLESLTGEDPPGEVEVVTAERRASEYTFALMDRTLRLLKRLQEPLVVRLEPQSATAAPAAAPRPPASAPAPGLAEPRKLRRGQPGPDCRLVPNPVTNGLNWHCP